jgi:hypothetical protein
MVTRCGVLATKSDCDPLFAQVAVVGVLAHRHRWCLQHDAQQHYVVVVEL